MADNTKIEWADATANFWIGCTKLSPACDHCYAERDWDLRKHRVTWGPHGDRSPVKAGAQVMRRMQARAAAFREEHGRPPRVFINSLSDFADNHGSINPAWREAVWQAARECPDVILMILTKRPQNLPGYLPTDWGSGYSNVWIGTTVENQVESDRRREHLRAIPAVVHFVSYEPALGPVDWAGWDFIKWLIAGGESGPRARPSHPDWYRQALSFAHSNGIAFHFKQWGEYHPADQLSSAEQLAAHRPMGRALRDGHAHSFDDQWTWKIGKKQAGRLLDGREWSEYPA